MHVHASDGEALNSGHYVAGNLLNARDPLGLDGMDIKMQLGEEARAREAEGRARRPAPEALAQMCERFSAVRDASNFFLRLARCFVAQVLMRFCMR